MTDQTLYDAITQLTGIPQNFAGEIIIYTLAVLVVIVMGGFFFTLVFRRRF